VWGGLNTGERENLIARAHPVAAAS
jgi:hypothetical protein